MVDTRGFPGTGAGALQKPGSPWSNGRGSPIAPKRVPRTRRQGGWFEQELRDGPVPELPVASSIATAPIAATASPVAACVPASPVAATASPIAATGIGAAAIVPRRPSASVILCTDDG